MARIRSIKPEFFVNEELADLEPLARLLFVGLWTQADRAGRMEYRPKRLKVAILPYDDCSIETMLEGLASRGFLTIYEVDGRKLIQINKFERHQSPHLREATSTLPEPDEHSTSTVQAPDEPIGGEGKGEERKGGERAPEAKAVANTPECLTRTYDRSVWHDKTTDTDHETPIRAVWSAIENATGGLVTPIDRNVFAAQLTNSLPCSGCEGSLDDIEKCVTVCVKAAEKTKGRPSHLFAKIVKEDR